MIWIKGGACGLKHALCSQITADTAKLEKHLTSHVTPRSSAHAAMRKSTRFCVHFGCARIALSECVQFVYTFVHSSALLHIRTGVVKDASIPPASPLPARVPYAFRDIPHMAENSKVFVRAGRYVTWRANANQV